jgi:hypothetical protein
MDGEPDDVRVRALDPGDEARRESLDAVCPSFVSTLAGREIPGDITVLEDGHLNRCRLDESEFPVVLPNAQARHYLMLTTRKPPQYSLCITIVRRLAEDLSVDHNGRVGSQHDVAILRQDMTALCGFLCSEPPDVRGWILAFVDRLIEINAQRLELEPGRPKQFCPTWRARRQYQSHSTIIEAIRQSSVAGVGSRHRLVFSSSIGPSVLRASGRDSR